MRKINLLFLFVWMSLTVFAQTNNSNQSLSLREAIDYAYNNSTTVKNAILSVADAEQQILERRAVGLPQVNGTLNYQHFLQVPKMALPETFVQPGGDREVSFQLKNSFTAGLEASSLVFDGTYLTALKAARIYKTYAQKDLQAKKHEVRSEITSAYMPILLLDETLDLINKNTNNISQLLEETKSMYKEGFVEQLDVDRLELTLANLAVEHENLTEQRKTAINGLKLLLGYPADEKLTLGDDIESILAQGNTQIDTANFQLNNRPEYEVALSGIQLNQLNIEQYKRGYLPNMSVFANYQHQYQGDNLKDGFWAPTFLVGTQINIPIFDGFDKRSKIERAKIQLMTAENQTKLLEKSIYTEIRNNTILFENALRKVEDRDKNVKLAERIYDTTKIKYREGVGSSLELSQAEQALFQAQNNYTQAVYDAIVAKIALNTALGK